jgi:hypothetical protein
MKARAKAITCLLVATATWTGGCARLVVLSPDVAATRNDDAWKTGHRAPVAAPVPAAAAAAPQPADPVVVPLPAATGPAPGISPAVASRTIAFRERPEVQQAAATPPDGYGVPDGLYEVDPLLAAHRREMQAQTSSRRGVGIGSMAFGVALGGLAAFGFSVASERADSTDQMVRDSAGGMYFWSAWLGVLALGELIAGTAMTFSSSDSTQLRTYYRDTYSTRP